MLKLVLCTYRGGNLNDCQERREKEDNTLTFQVESDAAEFEAAVNAAYLKNKHSINIPGFRKGKAPRAVVEGMYGAEVFYQDAMDELAPKAFEQGVTENDVKFVGAPSIVDVNVTDDKTVAYTFSVTLYPEVTLGQYKGLSAERYPAEVDEDEIGYELEAARKRNSRKVDVEREAQMGDVANIDFDGYLNGERFDGGKAEAYDLELGSGSFVPGFEEQIVGMNIGDEKDIDITFPENYAPELAGKAVVFKIKLNNLSVNELPELDDEFAKDNGFDTLDEYKADVKADLEKRKTEQRDGEVRADLMHKAIENMTVAVPEVMVKEKAEEIIRNYARNFGVTDNSIPMDKLCEMLGLNEEAMKTSIMPAAEAQVKNDLLLEAIVAAEGFAPTEEETEEYIAKTAEKLGAKAEELKQYFGVDFIAEEQKKEMASNIIFDTAIITEAAPEEKAEEKAEETEKEAE